MKRMYFTYIVGILIVILTVLCDTTRLINPYFQQILMYIGINIILTASLNLVNGYMGEFSVGHAAFMAIGAYAASICTVAVFPHTPIFFPLSLMAGGIAAALAGLVVAVPAFRARGDYLAIITLALVMITKSVIENLPWIGGPQGYSGMPKYTNLSCVVVAAVFTVFVLRNLVYSNFGRGIIAVRDDEIAANLVSVNTQQVKIMAFVISAFFAGIAGGLFAHLIQFINPRSFSLVKSTDVLLMLYLGGSGTLIGSIAGAAIWTVLIEALRFLGIWRFVAAPVLLILIMIFRPKGIMGGHELRFFIPKEKRYDTIGK
jgi:branched-chain amino acid transport system permease protein